MPIPDDKIIEISGRKVVFIKPSDSVLGDLCILGHEFGKRTITHDFKLYDGDENYTSPSPHHALWAEFSYKCLNYLRQHKADLKSQKALEEFLEELCLHPEDKSSLTPDYVIKLFMTVFNENKVDYRKFLALFDDLKLRSQVYEVVYKKLLSTYEDLDALANQAYRDSIHVFTAYSDDPDYSEYMLLSDFLIYKFASENSNKSVRASYIKDAKDIYELREKLLAVNENTELSDEDELLLGTKDHVRALEEIREGLRGATKSKPEAGTDADIELSRDASIRKLEEARQKLVSPVSVTSVDGEQLGAEMISSREKLGADLSSRGENLGADLTLGREVLEASLSNSSTQPEGVEKLMRLRDNLTKPAPRRGLTSENRRAIESVDELEELRESLIRKSSVPLVTASEEKVDDVYVTSSNVSREQWIKSKQSICNYITSITAAAKSGGAVDMDIADTHFYSSLTVESTPSSIKIKGSSERGVMKSNFALTVDYNETDREVVQQLSGNLEPTDHELLLTMQVQAEIAIETKRREFVIDGKVELDTIIKCIQISNCIGLKPDLEGAAKIIVLESLQKKGISDEDINEEYQKVLKSKGLYEANSKVMAINIDRGYVEPGDKKEYALRRP